MPTIHDTEFGDITIRRNAKARSVRMRIRPDGTISVSAPLYTPMLYIRRSIRSSRAQLRSLTQQHSESTQSYASGMQIGKTHSLLTRTGDALRVQQSKQQIIVTLPITSNINDNATLLELRPFIQKAMRKEAKSYLPRRLSYLASQYGYSYQSVRFSHASSRWGSCSSAGTISLNIALMKLPFELIDYVLIHELAHTRHMDHSHAFWDTVSRSDPDYKKHRKSLKEQTPAI